MKFGMIWNADEIESWVVDGIARVVVVVDKDDDCVEVKVSYIFFVVVVFEDVFVVDDVDVDDDCSGGRVLIALLVVVVGGACTGNW